MRKLNRCALCDAETALELSHIVPKMAVRELKKTSAGAIRNTENPNLTVQDSEKHYMLCSDCEDRFSKYETYFAKTLFHPYIKSVTDSFNYDINLAKFITSVNWRSTYLDILDYVETGVDDIRMLNCLIDSEKIMKDYLLEKRTDLGAIENHIFFFEEIKSISGKSIEEVQTLRPHVSIHRSITSYTFSYDHAVTCGNITNMMGIVLITLFCKGPTEKWGNTLIVNGNGTIAAKCQNVQSVVGNDFFAIMEQAKESYNNTSDSQKQKIAERLNAVGGKIKDFSVFKDWESDFNIEIED